MGTLADMIRENLETARSTAQRVRTRVRSRAEGILPMPSSNPGHGGVLDRLRGGGILSGGGGILSGGAGGGVMDRISQARERLLGGAGGGGVLGASKIREAGGTLNSQSKSGKIRSV